MKPKQHNSEIPDLKHLASERIEPFHYERTMTSLRQTNNRSTPVMKVFKNTSIVSGAIVAIVLALLLIPAGYSVRVGTVVEVEFVLEDQGQLNELMEASENLEGPANSQIQISNNLTQISFGFKHKDARSAEQSVRNFLSDYIPDLDDISFRVREIRKEMGGNALAAITGGKITILTESLSDDEIEAQIMSALNARGLKGNVDVQTSDNGDERQIEIRIEAQPGEEIDHGMSDLNFDIITPESGGEKKEKKIIKRRKIEERN